jgi:hypothetical protein
MDMSNYSIGGYSIIGNWWLVYWWLLVVILGYIMIFSGYVL